MTKKHFIVVSASVLLANPGLLAQFRASIRGTVSDQTGAVIQGATVTLTDLGTARVLTSVSDASGLYTFNALAPDEYSISVDRPGFKKKLLDHVSITPEQANAINVTLEPGEATQTVTVQGDQVPALDTATASLSGTISSNEIQHLPSFGRDVMQLAQLAPGSFGDGAQGGGGGTNNIPGSQIGGAQATDGIFKTENGPQIIANGGQNNANGVSIDGISTASAVWGGTTVITPSEDSVGDVKVVTNSYDAENGRFSGAQIQVTSKAGTNDIHGSLFFKADRPGLNAYQRYNSPNSVNPGNAAARGLLRDDSRFNQFGGSVGGPIWKNRVFAFFSYETLRNNTSSTTVSWYDAAQLAAQAPTGSIAATYLNFPGAQVSALSQVAANCGNIGLVEGQNCATVNGGLDIGSPLKTARGTQDLTYQSSGNPGVGSGLDGIPDIGEYTTLNPNKVTESQYNGRLDVQATQNDRFTFTIYWVPADTTSYSGPVRPYNLNHHSAINDAFAVIWNHIFSPTFLNEARVNAAGWRWNEVATNPQAPFGLATDTISQIGTLNASTTGTTFQTFGAFGPSILNQWTYGYQDVATKVLGRQTIKFGGGLTRLYYLNEAAYAARPQFTFFNLWDFLNDAPEAESGTFSPITGLPTLNREDTRSNLWSAFVQDDFKVTPELTVNMGLRWGYFGALASKQNNLNVLEFGQGANFLADASIHHGGGLYQSQKGNFGPQLGFAWSPQATKGRFVLRGGFGMNYNQEETAIAANGGNNFPSVTNANLTSTSPTQINQGIVYQLPSDPKSLFGYPSNPSTIQPVNANNLPATGSTSVVAYPHAAPTIYTYHYSLDTQFDLGHQWVATAGYQSSLGHHLIHQTNANVLAAANGYPLNPALNSVSYFYNGGISNYHALITTLKHTFSKIYSIEGQYTWSKSLDDGSQPYYEDAYPYQPSLAYGRSDFNVGQAFKVFGLWQPVFFHGNSWAEKVAGGWSISGIFNLHTGFPWTPTYSNVPNGSLYYQGSGFGGGGTPLRPAAYKGGAGHDQGNDAFKTGDNIGGAFNKNYSQGALAYFTVPTFTPVTGPLPQTFAPPENPGVSRNFLTGPRYKDVDATVGKAFGLPKLPVLGENGRIEVRADAFNLFNNLNFNTTSINTAISNDGVTSNPNFGQAQSALGSRTLDIQARFSF